MVLVWMFLYNNSIAGFHTVPENKVARNFFTISANGASCYAYWHPYLFVASKYVFVCEPKPEFAYSLAFCLYVCEAINSNKWRFDYYRKCGTTKLLQDVKIALSVKNGDIDFDFIEQEVCKTHNCHNLLDLINAQTSMQAGNSNE